MRQRTPGRRAVNGNNAWGPALGEVRYHARTGLMYVFNYTSKERLGWLRFDTLARGRLRDFPFRYAHTRDLRKFNRKALRLDPRRSVTVARLEFD